MMSDAIGARGSLFAALTGLTFLALTSGCAEGSLSGKDVVWVSVPAGTFVMGCTENDLECDGFNDMYGESPAHSVKVPSFEMTQTEITQYQYWKVMREQPSSHPKCGECPVEHMVNHYHDAQEFCESLGGRLPSEAEWEYAARAGSSTVYSCGSNSACLDRIAWHASNSVRDDGMRHPRPVAQKEPNAFGLYDMFGNVQEWTEDCSHDDFQGAPTDGSAWMEGGDCSRHVFKGSTYNTELGTEGTGWMVRPSGRYWDPVDIRGVADGFRCARDVHSE